VAPIPPVPLLKTFHVAEIREKEKRVMEPEVMLTLPPAMGPVTVTVPLSAMIRTGVTTMKSVGRVTVHEPDTRTAASFCSIT
jgi:hypothetical protein